MSRLRIFQRQKMSKSIELKQSNQNYVEISKKAANLVKIFVNDLGAPLSPLQKQLLLIHFLSSQK